MSGAEHVHQSSATAGPSNPQMQPAISTTSTPQSAAPSAGDSIAALTHVSSRMLEQLSAIESRLTSFESGSATPAQATPAQTAPAQTAPAQTAPAQTAPAQTAPAQTAPAQTAPAQTAPQRRQPQRRQPQRRQPQRRQPQRRQPQRRQPQRRQPQSRQAHWNQPQRAADERLVGSQQPEHLQTSGQHHEIALAAYNENIYTDLGGTTIATLSPAIEPFSLFLVLLLPRSHPNSPLTGHWSTIPREHPHQVDTTNQGICNSHTHTYTELPTMPGKGKRKDNPGKLDRVNPPLKTRIPVTDHPEPQHNRPNSEVPAPRHQQPPPPQPPSPKQPITTHEDPIMHDTSDADSDTDTEDPVTTAATVLLGKMYAQPAEKSTEKCTAYRAFWCLREVLKFINGDLEVFDEPHGRAARMFAHLLNQGGAAWVNNSMPVPPPKRDGATNTDPPHFPSSPAQADSSTQTIPPIASPTPKPKPPTNSVSTNTDPTPPVNSVSTNTDPPPTRTYAEAATTTTSPPTPRETNEYDSEDSDVEVLDILPFDIPRRKSVHKECP
ncbi:hypothetical protein L211DRAFT_871889 [Terfezia boudieri ATCC MYA-4762]|uniref:Uncharacterized protein n=1 Tax=Terfezia boudieri ATCC MYA-4762 TaxID=1051890 RepID=A0A3N4L5M1_9PEZI|nr:hypothetical protein L211DRAFT_871889 [Terfezia boudieri ATCC MYA-4762]